MSEWHVELLTSPDQIDDVLAVEDASFTNPWTRAMYLAELDNPGVAFCLIAIGARGNVVGFCSFWRVVDELHINNLAVLPAYRRRGVATALLTHVLEEGVALSARRTTLEMRRSNTTAQALYERFGFTLTAVRAAYYTHPVEDALIYWREDIEVPARQP